METVIDLLNAYLPAEWALKPWMLEVFIVVLTTGILSLIARIILKFLVKKSSLTKNWWDDALLDAVQRPIALMIWIIGLTVAAEITFIESGDQFHMAVINTRKIAIVLGIAWVLLRMITNFEKTWWSHGHPKKMDETTFSAVTKLLRVSIIVTTALICLQTLGISVAGVMAAGGVGGLAIGFAAKDMLSNFFGALTIYLDKPFKVGDWIRSPDQEIEGTVENIGWRLTLIRTFDKRPLYVPNAVFTRISVENPSRMQNRRIKETIGVRYDDIQQVHKITSDIEKMLREHPEIDTKTTLFINLNGFGASSVDMLLYCFTKTTQWVPYHGIKQDVLLKIAAIIQENGASIAFPTRTLHIAGSKANEIQTPDR